MATDPHNKTVIIIAGPTAVGKTAVAITIAKHFHTEIISADSRQCFKELNIGVARPSAEELSEVKHHFIASHSIQEQVTAADFANYALNTCAELFREHDTIVMTGGTGLYINAFAEGLDKIPPVLEEIRNTISAQYQQQGFDWLKKEIAQKDPLFFANGEIENPQRMMRALEVMESTGQSILSFQKKEKKKRDFNIIKIGLELPKEELNTRINTRVDKMMENGLLEEVKPLLRWKELNALQTVGYKELFDYLENKLSLAQAIEQIKISTRQYAKRQFTWFRKDKEMNWFAPPDIQGILSVALCV